MATPRVGLGLPAALERHRRLLEGAAIVVAVLGVGALSGRLAMSHYGKAVVEVGIGVPVLIAVARRPMLAVVALLTVVASIFAYNNLPRANLPGHPPINLADMMLIASVGGTLWRRPWNSWPAPVRRYAIALLVLLALASVATVRTALIGYTQSRDALYEYRNWMYLAVALTVALELSGTLWRRWIDIAIGAATVVAIVSIAAAASHGLANELLKIDPTAVYSPSVVAAAGGVSLGGTSRIRLEGLYFIYSMCIPAVVMSIIVRDRWQRLRVVALLLMLAAVALSLNRNMYGGTVVGLIVTALIAGPRIRHRLAMTIAASVLVVVLVTLTSITPAISSQVGKRLATVLTPSQIVQSSSYQDRAYELSFALPSIARNPLYGVGPRQPYGAFVITGSGTSNRFFVQNLYIDIATDYGIPTALAFLLIPCVCLAYGASRVRHAANPFDRALLAAAIGTLVSLMLSCLVDTFVQDPETTVAFGAACGFLLAAALRTERDPHKDMSLDVRTI